jgi:urease accessory protein
MSLENIGRQGVLRLTFERRADYTALIENYSRPPMQVMRAIPDEAGAICVYLLSPTGGVVQGDRYQINICAGEGTHSLFTTQSATKIYRMPQGWAEQHVDIEVGRDAFFEFLPDAAILFADADLRQQIDLRLQPGAMAMVYEIVMPGRVARGEHLHFRRYSIRVIVRDSNGLLLHDTADIQPGKTDLRSVGRLEGYSCWGSIYLVGDLAKWNITPLSFCEAHQGIMDCEDTIGSLSPLFRNGLCGRMLSERLETIYKAFYELRSIIRTQYMRLPDAPVRK